MPRLTRSCPSIVDFVCDLARRWSSRTLEISCTRRDSARLAVSICRRRLWNSMNTQPGPRHASTTSAGRRGLRFWSLLVLGRPGAGAAGTSCAACAAVCQLCRALSTTDGHPVVARDSRVRAAGVGTRHRCCRSASRMRNELWRTAALQACTSRTRPTVVQASRSRA